MELYDCEVISYYIIYKGEPDTLNRIAKVYKEEDAKKILALLNASIV